MDVFNHFSCYTKLPVRLEHVIEHIVEQHVVQHIEIFQVDIDPNYLCGFCWVYDEKPHNSINTIRKARIVVSQHLPPEWARLVICKELLHLLDNHQETAQTKAQVDGLIEEIVLPPEAMIGTIAASDHNGLVLALAVMMPRDAIDDFKPLVADGKVSIETIAKLAGLPEPMIRITFSPLWEKMVERFTAKFPQPATTPDSPAFDFNDNETAADVKKAAE